MLLKSPDSAGTFTYLLNLSAFEYDILRALWELRHYQASYVRAPLHQDFIMKYHSISLFCLVRFFVRIGYQKKNRE